MKTIYYILIALFMTASFTSCTADSIADEDVSIEEVATTGENGQMDEEDSGGGQ